MLKSLFEMGVTPFCSARLLQWFALVVVVVELLTGSVLDGFVYIILYPAYGDVYETSVPCLIAYLLPTKPVRRLMFIVCIPVVCLWNVGRKTHNRHCADLEVVDENKVSLRQSRTSASRRRRLFSYSSKKIFEVYTRLQKNCQRSRVCRYYRPCLQFSCRLFLPAGNCIRQVWNIICWNAVCKPVLAQNYADVQLRNSACSHTSSEEGGPKRESGTPPGILPLSSWRHRCLSWGELVHLNDERYQVILRRYSLRLRFYRLLPLKKASYLWGRFNQLQLPVWLRAPVMHLYIWVFGCCLEDALVRDLRHYKNLSEFFQRSLRPGIRPIHNACALVSPVDGTVLHFGTVKRGVLEQVKGVMYSLRGFLGPMEDMMSCISTAVTDASSVGFSIEKDCDMKTSIDAYIEALGLDDIDYYQNLLVNPENHLFQCIIYLAPGDYHRFHSPADWTVFCRRHFPGELFSVNPGFVRWLQGIFTFNERALYIGRWQHGFFSMAAVGATNVGSISVHFDKTLSTNVQSVWDTGSFHDTFFVGKQQNGVTLQKGEDFGTFNLGSTIVLVFEAPPTFRFEIDIGQKMKYGQALGNQ